MTRLKTVAFAAAAILLSLVVMTAVLLALDLYAHRRVERSAGLNWRGYRGPTVDRKQPGELRVAMFGGSTVFGYGVDWDETIPAALERALRAALPGRQVTVVNLGVIGEGAYAFLPNLQDFDDLQYDIVCLYEGYNDLLGDQRPNVDLVRHESTVFRLTGYFPVLPLVIGEKIMALKFGTVDAAYEADRAKQRERAVFHPNAAERTSSSALLQAASNLSKALGRQVERLATEEPSTEPSGKSGCPPPWVRYCDFTSAAVEFATSRGDSVIVAAQPQLVSDAGRDRHASQQRALADLAARVFSRNPRVGFVDLGTAIDLSDTAYTFDGMHLTREGNVLIAQALVEPVLALARERSQ